MDSNKSRKCRKCSKQIPNRMRIDGVIKNLRNRKFCTECSPYMGHNTHPHDPTPNQKGRRKSKDRNRQQVLSTYKRGLERKCRLVEQAGGKCKSCGYNANIRVLTFHHVKPEDKRFALALNELWSRAWQDILEEASKCELLCFNCHMDIHHRDSEIIKAVNSKYGTHF